jgi:hypothetical protein
MKTDTLTLAIIGHLVGDYLLQNDWMALNKKRNPIPCFIHCILWTAAVCLFAGWNSPYAIAALFCTHFIQDHSNIVAWWMRLRWKDQSRFMRCDDFDLTDMRVIPGLGPWSIIMVDNVWHIVTIWAVWLALKYL